MNRYLKLVIIHVQNQTKKVGHNWFFKSRKYYKRKDIINFWYTKIRKKMYFWFEKQRGLIFLNRN